MVAFQSIPPDLRVPGWRVEVGVKKSINLAGQGGPTLLVGQRTSAGTATVNVPVRCDSESQASALAGAGSMLHRMYAAAKLNDPYGEIWILPVDDHASGVAAVSDLTVSGTATESGTLPLTVGGIDVDVGVTSGDTAATVRAAIIAAITAKFPVTPSSGSGVVTFTAKNKGTLGNTLTVVVARLGSAAGQKVPAGLTVTPAAFASGATDPVLTTPIAALADQRFDAIALPWSGATELTAMGGEVASRWQWDRMVYGHVWSAKRDTSGNLITFGLTRNAPEVTVLGHADSASPVWDWAAAYASACGRVLRERPNASVGGVRLKGVLAPPLGGTGRWDLNTRNNLLKSGIATSVVVNDEVVVEAAVTTYRLDEFGNASAVWRQSERRALLARILREQKERVEAKYFEAALGDDGEGYDPDVVVVTENTLRAELVGIYRDQARRAWVNGGDESVAQYETELKVERDPTDRDRMNVLNPPSLINHLRRIAVRTEVGA